LKRIRSSGEISPWSAFAMDQDKILDSQLKELLGQHDPTARERILGAYGVQIYEFLRRDIYPKLRDYGYCKNESREIIRDALHDAVLAMVDGWQSDRADKGRVFSLLCRITINKIWDHHRRKRTRDKRLRGLRRKYSGGVPRTDAGPASALMQQEESAMHNRRCLWVYDAIRTYVTSSEQLEALCSYLSGAPDWIALLIKSHPDTDRHYWRNALSNGIRALKRHRPSTLVPQ
jgi:DNA-directed RNA polymerase specialized sigma24 family protein